MSKWYVRYDADGQTRICDEDFTHDVELILTGDFADQDQRSAFAHALANLLSGGTDPSRAESAKQAAYPPAPTPHFETAQCGFDRNSSHSENTYVCNCGWREPA